MPQFKIHFGTKDCFISFKKKSVWTIVVTVIKNKIVFPKNFIKRVAYLSTFTLCWDNVCEIYVFYTCNNKIERGVRVVSRASWTSKGAGFSS